MLRVREWNEAARKSYSLWNVKWRRAYARSGSFHFKLKRDTLHSTCAWGESPTSRSIPSSRSLHESIRGGGSVLEARHLCRRILSHLELERQRHWRVDSLHRLRVPRDISRATRFLTLPCAPRALAREVILSRVGGKTVAHDGRESQGAREIAGVARCRGRVS